MLSSNFINAYKSVNSDFVTEVGFLTSLTKNLDQKTLLVADSNTKESIPFHGDFKLLVLPSTITAEMRWVDYIRLNKPYETLLAFGGGTINDLCKYASYLDSVNFITCPTASSVNGYSSATASIITNGVKKSYKAHIPKKIYIALDILVNSPMRLILSGFSEVICRFTTKPDWLLSHLLFNSNYSEAPFQLTAQLEKELLVERKKLTIRDPATIQTLMEILLLSGLGMNLVGGSYPWSQGEHQIVHTMEIKGKNNNYFHGEKIGVATVTMAKLQNFILENTLNENFLSNIEKKVAQYYPNFIEHLKILCLKHDNLRLDNWEKIVARIKGQVIKTEELVSILSSVGGVTQPEEVGWEVKEYQNACKVACAMRDRFTFLDLFPYTQFNFSP